MWLFAKNLIGFLSVIQGLRLTHALHSIANGNPCITKILSCDIYRQHFTPSREQSFEMFTEIEDLNKACKEQEDFLKCIQEAETFCKKRVFPNFAQEMIRSRLFPVEICRPDSTWQQLYLKDSSCLTEYSGKALVSCFEVIFGPYIVYRKVEAEQLCRNGTLLFECASSILQKKCGYFAGNILKKYLMFTSFGDYKCSRFSPEERDEDILSSSPDYDIKEAKGFDKEATEGADVKTHFENSQLHLHESQVSPSDSKEAILLKFGYIHTSKTTFALYEHMEKEQMRYMGCGKAELFWVILLPPRNKYCGLTDLKSGNSEVLFKCTIRFDVPCSPDLDDEDRRRMALVFRRKYAITVASPSNSPPVDTMVTMYAYYLKLYPSPSAYVPERKVNLWTTQANKTKMERTEYVDLKRSLEQEFYRNIRYQRRRGSGQEWETDAKDFPTDLDEDEYYDEYENLVYYPLEKEEDIYFPHLRTNNIIYIEDDKGELMSLHDHRSPIYSKFLYQPHSMFRPLVGTTPSSTTPRHFEKNRKDSSKLSPNSIFKRRESEEFQDEAVVSEFKPDQREYCTTEASCAPKSELKIKPGMYILTRNIETVDPFKGTNQLRQRIPSPIKMDDSIDLKPFLISRDGYVVTPSAEIEVPESTDSSKAEELQKDEIVIEPSKYSREEDESGANNLQTDIGSCDNVINTAQDSRYLDTDYISSVIRTLICFNCKKDYMELLRKYYIDAFTRPPYLHKRAVTKENSKGIDDLWNINAESSSRIKLLWKKYLAEIIKKISNALFEKFLTSP